MNVLRTAAELSHVDDPAWPLIESWLASSTSAVVLAPEPILAARTLYRLQVTTRSALGALAYNCGGIIVDHGWLRLLGGGTGELVDLATANELGDPTPDQTPPAHLTVAYDVLGGTFAINGGGLPGRPGSICYWAPDDLDWADLGVGHGEFVHWAIAGQTAEFYADLRWDGWEAETEALRLDQALSVYPPPSTVEGRDIGAASRRPVPLEELRAFNEQLAAAAPPNGEQFEFRISD